MDRHSMEVISVSKVVTRGTKRVRTRFPRATHLLWLLVITSCETPAPVATPALRVRTELAAAAPAEWSEPVNLGAPINSTGADQSPTLSADNLSLYFASDRPGGLGGVDLWVSHRATPESAWETPVNLGPAINSADVESGPDLSLDGHLLFFQSSRPGGEGSNDIYVSHRADVNDDFGWGDPVNVGSGVNTAAGEFGPWFSENGADGPVLYFARGPNNTFTQLYSAPVTRDGSSRGPATPVAELNDPNVTQGRPTVRVNGREIVFYSNRPGGLGGSDLWTATRQSVNDSWSPPVNLGAPLNSSAGELLPALSRDGRTLLFTTNNRPGGLGGMDIWMSTRLPRGVR
jgi:Tol biopolymer transport system component